jgi:TPP-dependent pyruvate/acetoin dehydrogenase alpha subunit
MMSLSPNLPPDKQREMLRQMLMIRRFEERASADYLAGKIYGVVHCYIGEEAVAVGVSAPLSATTGSSRRIEAMAIASPRVPISTA